MTKQITPALTHGLQSQLDPSTKLVTAGLPDYEIAIARWSQASVKAAVRIMRQEHHLMNERSRTDTYICMSYYREL